MYEYKTNQFISTYGIRYKLDALALYSDRIYAYCTHCLDTILLISVVIVASIGFLFCSCYCTLINKKYNI